MYKMLNERKSFTTIINDLLVLLLLLFIEGNWI